GAGDEQSFIGVTRHIEAVGALVALQRQRAGARRQSTNENTIGAVMASHDCRAARVDATGIVDLKIVEIAAAVNFYGRRLNASLDVDGRAIIVRVDRLRIAVQLDGCAAMYSRPTREVDIVTSPQFDGLRRVDETFSDRRSKLGLTAHEQIDVLVHAR